MIGETHPLAASRWTATGRRPAEDQPLDTWLKQELGRAYDDALDETLPEELLDLLRDVPPTRH
jgi:hypothetical protein